MTDRYLGKFPGVVVDNKDPDKRCRIDVNVPAVMAESTGWCLPALPYAGDGVGMAVVPPVGASVWVEWPDGDLGKPPVWSGAWFTPGKGVPGAGPNTFVIVTPGGHRVEISDDSQAITLTASGGASITIGSDGITLDDGQGGTLALSGGTISMNDDSLQVT